jgi:hypothetical protein
MDLFLETSEPYLLTYEISINEIDNYLNKKKINCIKKQNHRNIYLEYEGQISNDRGYLKIIEKGLYKKMLIDFNEHISIQKTDNELLIL